MRLDVWLSKVCLVKSRSQAKSGCHAGKILLKGATVRESRSVKEGDEITLYFPGKVMELRVLALPTGNVPKKQARDYYELLEERLIDDRLL